MSEWKETKLGNVIELKRGYDLPQRQRIPGTVPIVSSSGVSDFHNKAMVKAPGVVTGRYGTIGQVFYIKEDFWPLNTALYVRDFKGNDPKFISYFLQTLDFQVFSDKAAVPGLNRNHLHEAKVRIPLLIEQRAIAHVLSSLDDKIELNRRMNETLEAMARALFKDWFVDFGPVRAKMEGRQPPGLTTDMAALFPDTLDLEGKPVGWSGQPLSYFIELIGGGTPKTSVADYWNGDIPWFSVVDAPNATDVFVIKTQKTITHLGLYNSSARLLPEGATIISARGTVGKLAVVGRPMAMNQSCYAATAAHGWSTYFIYFLLKNAVQGLQSNTHGSVFDTITRNTFDAVNVIRPSQQASQAFDSVVMPWMDKIRMNLFEAETLASLRDLLLPKLLSGEIRIKNVEQLIGDAL